MPDLKVQLFVDKTPQLVSARELAATGFSNAPMTTAQRDALVNVPTGYMIYNSTTNKLNVRTAGGWEAVTSA
jgi:hypothetical protein